MSADVDPTTLSYTRGEDRPLLDLTIGELLHRTASRYPDRLAVASRHQSKRMTWAELSDAADRVARGLWSLGIRRGDRVGLWSTNCIEWIMMHMGCARAGAALVNVNPAYRSHELQYTLTRSRMKALFLWHKDKHADYEEILDRARHGLNLELAAHHLLRLAGVARAARRRGTTARSRRRRRRRQHPVHQRNNRHCPRA